MDEIYLLSLRINGIKTIDNEIELSFYKKTIDSKFPAGGFNVKGIYGMNGAGKSAIVEAVSILKNTITVDNYFRNAFVQKYLNEIINKKTEQLTIEVEYTFKVGENIFDRFCYQVEIEKSGSELYSIAKERLCVKKAKSNKAEYRKVYTVEEGEIIGINANEMISVPVRDRTRNLLKTSTLPAVFFSQVITDNEDLLKNPEVFIRGIFSLYVFGNEVMTYIEADDHTDYVIQDKLPDFDSRDTESEETAQLIRFLQQSSKKMNMLSARKMFVRNNDYGEFCSTVKKLRDFIVIFKRELVDIRIEKRIDGEYYACSLIMDYGEYQVDAEFESTGIKKLISLFGYLREASNGGIVFIDEMDANLHDVYLCAIIKYFIDFGKGQLCFTTHNIGPMDILKTNKNSIEFLSESHKMVPWRNSGHYSPSSLYKKGMIEGSPFNIDEFEFVGVLDDDNLEEGILL